MLGDVDLSLTYDYIHVVGISCSDYFYGQALSLVWRHRLLLPTTTDRKLLFLLLLSDDGGATRRFWLVGAAGVSIGLLLNNFAWATSQPPGGGGVSSLTLPVQRCQATRR
jgi:hypothetical protein